MANTFNQPSDWSANPLTIPANQLLTITDVNGNIVGHRTVSRPNDQTDNNSYFANKFSDTTLYAYPLTASFAADPNAGSIPDGDFV